MKTIRIKVLSAFLVLAILCSFAAHAAAAGPSSTAGVVTLGSGNLNVRSAPNTTSMVLTKLPNGSYVTLLSKNGSWWNVEYAKGQYGYCYATYITQVSGTYSASVSSGLNVRSGPGTSYGVIGGLNRGDYAVVFPSSGTWKQILFDGCRTGYVNGSYLDASSAYAPVSLSVPSYKQTDARWANTPIGSSGETIGSIGCPTVALAMTESYRTGTTIYPNVMAGKLNYTPGGAVYWPGNYAAYSGGDYSVVIYNLLKAGKPVLVGSRNAYGGSHWVVVTGYTGDSALLYANFTINDPGSNSRTTLQQFFSAYPYFYKIMHY